MTTFALSADGVRIAYSTAGHGKTALVFIHGGLADRTFWSNQIETFSDRFQVIALDLAGHGESGRNRAAWSIQAFGRDVHAVAEAENVSQAVMIGNSLGGPAGMEAALLMPERTRAVIGVDTFHLLDHRLDPAEVKERARQFQADYAGMVRQMVAALFHPDADPALMSDIEKRMIGASDADTAGAMFATFSEYDTAASVARLKAPIRCINGDIFPVNFERNRALHADFDAVILPHTGHYPMLECPEEFNRRLSEVLANLRLAV